MNEHAPELSIIIAVCNAAKALDKTLGGFPDRAPFSYEVVIQDAMSDDATEQIVQDYAGLPILFERAPDNGIYDAWNKALARVSGKWTIFIGAGDSLDWLALEQCMATLRLLPDHVEYYATPVRLITPSGSSLELIVPSAAPAHDLPQGMSLPHPGLFHRSTLFGAYRFDATCRIAGDYDFLCRTLHNGNVRVGEIAFASMLTGGVSGSMDSMYSSEKELLQFSRKYFPQVFPLKPFLRLTRSGGYLAARWLLGARVAGYYADLPRLAKGKPRLWSLPEKKVLTGFAPVAGAPSIDLLAATLGRVDELGRLLTSLEKQTYKNFHIWLADQNPPGFLDDMLASHSGLPLTRIMLPSRGVSAARNALLAMAQGELIAFPDDDCWYAPDTLANVVDAFRKHPQCGVLLGVWTPREDMPPPCSKEGPVGRIGLFRQGGTCVQFFRKEVIEGIRFDPVLGPGTGLPYGCGEDSDFLLYAHARAKVCRCPSIRVFHPSPLNTLPNKDKIQSYASGRIFLLRKHKFSLWFQIATVFFPLCMVPIDGLRRGRRGIVYRWAMFRARLRAFFAQRTTERRRG